MRVDSNIYAWDVAKIEIECRRSDGQVRIRIFDAAGEEYPGSFAFWGPRPPRTLPEIVFTGDPVEPALEPVKDPPNQKLDL